MTERTDFANAREGESKGQFSAQEWDLLVKVPRWVVRAASASQRDSARRTRIEVEAGFISVAGGRDLASPVVKQIAQETMGIFDERSALPETAGISFADTEAGLAGVIERAQAAVRVMDQKAPDAAAAYRRWLLTISEVVISAARSHDFLGLGGVYVTESEHAFDRRLAGAIGA